MMAKSSLGLIQNARAYPGGAAQCAELRMTRLREAGLPLWRGALFWLASGPTDGRRWCYQERVGLKIECRRWQRFWLRKDRWLRPAN